MTDKFGFVPCESALLDGYGLVAEDFDYYFVGRCGDVGKLVKILRVLRSGEVGHYPGLIDFTEDRIRHLKPDHVLLRSLTNVWSKQDMGAQWDEVQADLMAFCGLVQPSERESPDRTETTSGKYPIREKPSSMCKEDDDAKNVEGNLPAGKCTKRESSVTICSPKCGSENRIKSGDFAGWDRYDAEEGLQKLDTESDHTSADNKGNNASSAVSFNVASFVNAAGMSEEEKRIVAAREKDKGSEAYRAADYAEAVIYFGRSISVQPTTCAMNNRAQAFIKLRKFDEALSDLDYVCQHEPHNVKAHLRQGTINFDRLNYANAKKHFLRAKDLSPESAMAIRMVNQIEDISRGTNLSPRETTRRGPVIEVVE